MLADKFGISNRAVSKWETGKSLPDPSIMLELCDLLGITVNELLSGERITMENYQNKAEENLLEMQNVSVSTKKKMRIIYWIYIFLIIAGTALFILSKGHKGANIVALSVQFVVIIHLLYLSK